MGSKTIFRRPLSAMVALASLFTLLLTAGKAAQAQVVYARVSNGVIQARLGESGQDFSQNGTGRFAVDDLRTLTTIMYGPTQDLVGVSTAVPVPGSFVTIRIDGGTAAGGWDLIFGEATGVWLLPPTELNGKIVARWATIPGTTTPAVPPIQVNVEITLVHSVVQYRFTIINGIQDTVPPTPGSAAHTVGLRFAQNYTTDTQTFVNEGPVFLSNGTQICTETTLTGSQVPSSWKVLDPTGLNPVGGILRPTPSNTSVVAPDQLIFGSAAIMSELWEHAPNLIPGFNFCTDPWDAAAALYFSPRTIAPGQSVDLVTYFGRQDTTIDFTAPWAAGIEARSTLDLTDGAPSPNPFTITAFVVNQAAGAFSSVSATINLPTGLELAPGETATKTSGGVGAGQEQTFSWNVVPNGQASGKLTYSVSFAASPGGQGRVITRTIEIPALPVQNLQGGLQMVSFPYTFTDPNPTVALGLSAADFGLLRWNPVNGQYEAVSRIAPGEGYWLNLAAAKKINLTGATPVSTGTGNFEIKLQLGWNQIGNPFPRIVNWNDVLVLSTQSSDPNFLKPIAMDQAAAAGLIQPILFRYDTTTHAYVFDSTTNTDLVPFVGYWVKALKPGVSLLIPPPPISRAASTRAASASTDARSDGWRVAIVATSGTTSDAANVIGISRSATDAVDIHDVEKPPSVQKGLTVGIQRTTADSRSALLAQDIQQVTGGRKTWNLVVRTPEPKQDVTLSWPSASALPRGYELFIADAATGIRQQMRQSPTLRFNTGDSATRSFLITAEPTSRTSGFVLTMTTRPGRAGGATTIEVASTQAASINVKIKGANGQTVRTLAGRSASLGSSASFVWDNRDAKGSAIAAGTYIVEVTGTTSDGQSRRAIQPLVIVR